MPVPELTHQQKEIIEHLANLLDFSSTNITNTKISLRIRKKKAILLTMMCALHNYSESILALLRESRTNAAEALLRPLLENLINLSFIYSDKTIENATRFILHDEYDRKRLGGDIKKFVIKYPELKPTLGVLAVYDWDKFIIKQDKVINKTKSKCPSFELKELPKIRQRAELVDLYRRKQHKKLKISLEWTYLTFYWYLSSINHLSIRGLGTFIDQKDSKVTLTFSGENKNIVRIAVMTYALYLEFLTLFIKEFKLLAVKDIKPYSNILKEYLKK